MGIFSTIFGNHKKNIDSFIQDCSVKKTTKLSQDKTKESRKKNNSYYDNPYILKKKIGIRLNSGREVFVHSFYFEHSYGTVIIGSKDIEYFNIKFFQKATYLKDWGERKTLKIKPSQEDLEKGLKPYCFKVWLDSEPINPDYCGSELVVIWYNDIEIGTSIEQIIHSGVKTINWEVNAQDFDY